MGVNPVALAAPAAPVDGLLVGRPRPQRVPWSRRLPYGFFAYRFLAMPLVRIETRRWLTPETKLQLFDAVHAALVGAFKIPNDDRAQRLLEYAPEDFEIPPGKGPRFTIIVVSAFAGRSLDAKRNLYRELVARLSQLGIPPKDVFVLLEEQPLDNWGIKGGVPASEAKLGFEVKV